MNGLALDDEISWVAGSPSDPTDDNATLLAIREPDQ